MANLYTILRPMSSSLKRAIDLQILLVRTFVKGLFMGSKKLGHPVLPAVDYQQLIVPAVDYQQLILPAVDNLPSG